jgi:hypothetical protein
MRNAFSHIQWKIAMARMQEANMPASEITEQGGLTQPAARKTPLTRFGTSPLLSQAF